MVSFLKINTTVIEINNYGTTIVYIQVLLIHVFFWKKITA